MSEKCPKHNIEFEITNRNCFRCRSEGVVEGDQGELVNCFLCLGEGEVEVPLCVMCDDEYEEEV